MNTIQLSIAELLTEYKMTGLHKAAIAQARRGTKHSSTTKRKISKSMGGKSNFEGKKHTKQSKDRISHKRGSYDPIGDKRWIVNINQKTYRKKKAPEGYLLGKRRWRPGPRELNKEEFLSFKEFIR